MKKSSLGTVGSVFMLIAVLICIFSIWRSTSAQESIAQADTSAYAPVDISGMKEQALTMTQAAENNAGVPIPVPVGKLGKTNPFAAPE